RPAPACTRTSSRSSTVRSHSSPRGDGRSRWSTLRAMAVDPLLRFRRWLRDAVRAGAPLAEAMSLATATRAGVRSLRMVLLKQADAQGFVFFTDARSRKGRELRANPRAAATFHWNTMGRQVRVEGRAVELSDADADVYWATRPRGSQ